MTPRQRTIVVACVFLFGAASILLYNLFYGLLDSHFQALGVAILLFVGAIILLVISLEAQPPLPPVPLVDALTQESFDYFANDFLERLTRRWKILAWSLSAFAAVGLAYFGVHVYELNQEISKERLAPLKKKIQEIVRGSGDLPKMLGRISSVSATYDLAADSPDLQKALGIIPSRLLEKKYELKLIQEGLSQREVVLSTMLLSDKNEDKKTSTWVNYKRVKMDDFTSALISLPFLLRTGKGVFQGDSFHESIEKSLDSDNDFVEPHIFLVDEILAEPSPGAQIDIKSLLHAGDHLEKALEALNSPFYQEETTYRVFLLGKLNLNLGIYFFAAGQLCAQQSNMGKDDPFRMQLEPSEQDRLCDQLGWLEERQQPFWVKLGSRFLKPKDRQQLFGVAKERSKFHLKEARESFRKLDKASKAAGHVFLSRTSFVEGDFADRVADKNEARKKLIEAIKVGAEVGLSNERALNTLAWMYSDLSQFPEKNTAVFMNKQFEAIVYAYLALGATVPNTHDWIGFLDTYALSLYNMGFLYHAVLKDYEILLATEVMKRRESEDLTKLEKSKNLVCQTLLEDLKVWGEGTISQKLGLLDRAIAHYEKVLNHNVSPDLTFKLGRLYQIKAITLDLCGEKKELAEMKEKETKPTTEVTTAEKEQKLAKDKGKRKVILKYDCKSQETLLRSVSLPDPGLLPHLALTQADQRVKRNMAHDDFKKDPIPPECDSIKARYQLEKTKASIKGTQKQGLSAQTVLSDAVSTLDVNQQTITEHFPVSSMKAALLNNRAWQAVNKGCATKVSGDIIEYARDAVVESRWSSDPSLHTLTQILSCSQDQAMLKQGWSILSFIFCKYEPVHPILEKYKEPRQLTESKGFPFRSDRCDGIGAAALEIKGLVK